MVRLCRVSISIQGTNVGAGYKINHGCVIVEFFTFISVDVVLVLESVGANCFIRCGFFKSV